MKSIYSFSKDITIFIVAHRLETLQQCNLILEVKDSNIISYSNIDEFSRLNQQ